MYLNYVLIKLKKLPGPPNTSDYQNYFSCAGQNVRQIFGALLDILIPWTFCYMKMSGNLCFLCWTFPPHWPLLDKMSGSALTLCKTFQNRVGHVRHIWQSLPNTSPTRGCRLVCVDFHWIMIVSYQVRAIPLALSWFTYRRTSFSIHTLTFHLHNTITHLHLSV